MKKKIMLSLAAVAMVGTLAVGGTLAWFTDTETSTNVVTTGHVDVKITENLPSPLQQDEGGYTAIVNEDKEGISYSGIEPGTVIDKNPVITYEGNAPAYVRYRVDVTYMEDNKVRPLDGSKVQFLHEDMSEAELHNGYVYSTKVYNTGDEVAKLFDKVKFSPECGNEIADAELTINIVADAIQADNLPMVGDTITEADIAAAFGDDTPDNYDDDKAVGEVLSN